MIITDGKRNAKFVGPVHKCLSVGAQDRCQSLEAYTHDRLLPDQCIV
jgi:hypothetical protein